MSDHTIEKELKEVGLITLKLKTKEAEVMIFDEEFVDETDLLDADVEKTAETIYETELAVLEASNPDGVLEEREAEARALADSAIEYYKGKKQENENDFISKLQTTVDNFKENENVDVENENQLINCFFKIFLKDYVEVKRANKDLTREIKKVEDFAKSKMKEYEEHQAKEELKNNTSFLKKLFK